MSLAVSQSLDSMLEKDWAALLFSKQRGLAPSLGWNLTYHVRYTQGSRPGFPDQVLIRDRIIFAELKREKGAPTDHQVEFLDGIAKAGGEVYLWRPSDLEEIGQILSKRWRYLPRGERAAGRVTVEWPLLVNGAAATSWTPGSLWVPELGRADSIPPVDDGQTTIDDFLG